MSFAADMRAFSEGFGKGVQMGENWARTNETIRSNKAREDMANPDPYKMTPEERAAFEQRGGTTGSTGGTGTGTGGGTPQNPSEAGKQLMKLYVSLGYSPAGAAGVVGNLQAESNFSTTVPGDKNKAGVAQSRGLAQWDRTRWGAMTRWAASQNLDPYKLETQGRYVDHELKTTMPGLYKQLKTATNPTMAAGLFARDYERPKGSPEARRTGDFNRIIHFSRRSGNATNYFKSWDPQGGSYVDPAAPKDQPLPPSRPTDTPAAAPKKQALASAEDPGAVDVDTTGAIPTPEAEREPTALEHQLRNKPGAVRMAAAAPIEVAPLPGADDEEGGPIMYPRYPSLYAASGGAIPSGPMRFAAGGAVKKKTKEPDEGRQQTQLAGRRPTPKPKVQPKVQPTTPRVYGTAENPDAMAYKEWLAENNRRRALGVEALEEPKDGFREVGIYRPTTVARDERNPLGSIGGHGRVAVNPLDRGSNRTLVYRNAYTPGQTTLADGRKVTQASLNNQYWDRQWAERQARMQAEQRRVAELQQEQQMEQGPPQFYGPGSMGPDGQPVTNPGGMWSTNLPSGGGGGGGGWGGQGGGQNTGRWGSSPQQWQATDYGSRASGWNTGGAQYSGSGMRQPSGPYAGMPSGSRGAMTDLAAYGQKNPVYTGYDSQGGGYYDGGAIPGPVYLGGGSVADYQDELPPDHPAEREFRRRWDATLIPENDPRSLGERDPNPQPTHVDIPFGRSGRPEYDRGGPIEDGGSIEDARSRWDDPGSSPTAGFVGRTDHLYRGPITYGYVPEYAREEVEDTVPHEGLPQNVRPRSPVRGYAGGGATRTDWDRPTGPGLGETYEPSANPREDDLAPLPPRRPGAPPQRPGGSPATTSRMPGSAPGVPGLPPLPPEQAAELRRRMNEALRHPPRGLGPPVRVDAIEPPRRYAPGGAIPDDVRRFDPEFYRQGPGGAESQHGEVELRNAAQQRITDRNQAYRAGVQPADIDRSNSDPSRYGPIYGPRTQPAKPAPKAAPKAEPKAEPKKKPIPPIPPPRPPDPTEPVITPVPEPRHVTPLGDYAGPYEEPEYAPYGSPPGTPNIKAVPPASQRAPAPKTEKQQNEAIPRGDLKEGESVAGRVGRALAPAGRAILDYTAPLTKPIGRALGVQDAPAEPAPRPRTRAATPEPDPTNPDDPLWNPRSAYNTPIVPPRPPRRSRAQADQPAPGAATASLPGEEGGGYQVPGRAHGYYDPQTGEWIEPGLELLQAGGEDGGMPGAIATPRLSRAVGLRKGGRVPGKKRRRR